MPTKSSSGGDNKNLTMGIVLAVLVVAIIGWWMYQGGGDDLDTPRNPDQPAVAEDAPKGSQSRPAPDRQVDPEEDQPESAQPTPTEEGPKRRGGNTDAPKREDTAPPA